MLSRYTIYRCRPDLAGPTQSKVNKQDTSQSNAEVRPKPPACTATSLEYCRSRRNGILLRNSQTTDKDGYRFL